VYLGISITKSSPSTTAWHDSRDVASRPQAIWAQGFMRQYNQLGHSASFLESGDFVELAAGKHRAHATVHTARSEFLGGLG
jgi:hypothetical protein